jgi:hypothetical protein
MSDTVEDILEIEIDVQVPDDVINYSQRELIKVVRAGSISDKDKVSALTALSRTALTQKRLKQDNANAEQQLLVAHAVLEALEKHPKSLQERTTIEGRANNIVVELPSITVLPGEDSTENLLFNYHDIMGDV